MANERKWQERAIEATRGNQSQLGAIILAMLARVPHNPAFPRFSGLATVTSDGFVMFAELLKWIARDYRAPAPALSENDPNAERKLK